MTPSIVYDLSDYWLVELTYVFGVHEIIQKVIHKHNILRFLHFYGIFTKWIMLNDIIGYQKYVMKFT